MTVIVYRDGILAADSLVCSSNTRIGSDKKIYKIKHYLIGAAGDTSVIEDILHWIKNGKDRDKKPTFNSSSSFEGIIINTKTAEVTYIELSCSEFPVKAPYYAIGIGADFALGAMYKGADAEEAVEAAISLSTACGGAIQVLRV